MASVNKVILVGNLGKDPEIRYLPSGDPVANITIATSSKYKGKDGNMVEETEWHRITFFGKLAEIVGQYLKKGRPIYVEGRLKTRKYTDKDGVEKYSTDIVANEMQMLGSREGGSDQGDHGGDQGYDQDGGNQGGYAQQPQQRQPQQNRPANQQPQPQQRPQQPQQNRPANQQPQQRPPQPQNRTPAPASGFDDMDDDIPF